MSLLDVRDLHTHFPTPHGTVRACNGVSFRVERGEILGIVGESGSGKTIAALSVMGLVPKPGAIVAGSIRFNGEELTAAHPSRLRALRGREMGMVFQDASRALDPVQTIGSALREAGAPGAAAERALERVGLPGSLRTRYPHQLSGGQRQRAMIAIAIARNPALVIADEPTTAVDAVSQVHVLRELVRVQRELGCGLIVISHNMGLVSRIADRVVVMYLGTVLEDAPVRQFVAGPAHPYSRALLASAPALQPAGRLQSIPGQPGRMTEIPAGCVFHPRCQHTGAHCMTRAPRPLAVAPGHTASCHLLDGQAVER